MNKTRIDSPNEKDRHMQEIKPANSKQSLRAAIKFPEATLGYPAQPSGFARERFVDPRDTAAQVLHKTPSQMQLFARPHRTAAQNVLARLGYKIVRKDYPRHDYSFLRIKHRKARRFSHVHPTPIFEIQSSYPLSTLGELASQGS